MSSRYRNILHWSIFLCLVGLLAACTNLSSTQGKLNAYVFPVKPGTDEWEQMGSRQEMLAAVQIPADRVAGISTAGLVETVLDYPLYMDMFAHNNLEAGLATIKHDFNGMQALLGRSDAGSVLLQRYQATDANAVSEMSDTLEQGDYVSRLTYLEMILAQPEIGERLSVAARRSLVEIALQQQADKAKLADIYGMAGGETAALLIGRTLQREQALQSDPQVEQFLRDGFSRDDGARQRVLQSLFEQARTFLDQTEG